MKKIPKIFHHVWFGPPPDDILVQCRESFGCVHPGWEKILWTEKDFVDGNWEVDVKAILAKRRWRLAGEVARLLILHRRGGFYVDHDVWAIKPFNCLCSLPGVVYAWHPGGGANGATGVIGSRPGSPLFLEGAVQTMETRRWDAFVRVARRRRCLPAHRNHFYPWYHREADADKYRKFPESVCTHLWLRARVKYDVSKLKEMQSQP